MVKNKTTKCIVCNNQIRRKLINKTFVFNFYLHNKKVKYKLISCRKCGVKYWDPCQLCLDFYNHYLPSSEIDTIGIRNVPSHERVFYLRNDLSGKHILDIGCGDGAFLEMARKKTPHIMGIDMDIRCCNGAREIRKLENVYALNWDEFIKVVKPGILKFDFVTMFDVLEHQSSPSEMIVEIKDILGKGGIVCGTVPNRRRLFNFFDWYTFMGDFPPAHLTRWDTKSLINFFKKNGFEEVVVINVGMQTLEETKGWIKSFFKLIRNNNNHIKSNNQPTIKQCQKNFNNNAEHRVKKLLNSVIHVIAKALYRKMKIRGSHLYFEAKIR